MVSSFLVEALSSPTDALLSFYDTYDHEAINEFPKAVAKHFSDIFRTEEAFLEVRSAIYSISKLIPSYNPRYLLSPPHALSHTAIALLSASAPWSKTRHHLQKFTCLNCETGNVAAGVCQTLPQLMGATPILTIMIYGIVSSCGPSAFPERRSGIKRCQLGVH
jgi:hypothetical protein